MNWDIASRKEKIITVVLLPVVLLDLLGKKLNNVLLSIAIFSLVYVAGIYFFWDYSLLLPVHMWVCSSGILANVYREKMKKVIGPDAFKDVNTGEKLDEGEYVEMHPIDEDLKHVSRAKGVDWGKSLGIGVVNWNGYRWAIKAGEDLLATKIGSENISETRGKCVRRISEEEYMARSLKED